MRETMSCKRKVIIGLDGMPFGLIERFSEDGTMPNLSVLVREGVFRPMHSSIPEVSSVAWSSIITGTNPGEHGIFGFTDIAPGTYRMTFPNFNSLKARPFWERPGVGRSVILNVPTTFPARALDGVLVAGFVALDLERAVYPASLVPNLEEMGYRVDVDSQKAHQSLDFFLRDLDRTLKARIAAYRYLWHEEEWDTFMLVFTGTDRLGHFMWDAYEDEAHRHREVFLDHFRQIDEVIGEIRAHLDNGDAILMLSDHGFERLDRDVYPNHLLRETGFLSFEAGAPPGLKTVAGDTKAFALDPARIYVNIAGKFPRGGVKPDDREVLLRELTGLFEGLEIEGKRVVKRVYRGEELYHGPEAHRAPDLVLLANKGFNLRGNFKAERLWGKDLFAGKHSQHDAFLLVWGDFEPGIVPEPPTVGDVVGIIDRL
jgi:predicted AlkP superfamily phosphohydrolase/phosphomutase